MKSFYRFIGEHKFLSCLIAAALLVHYYFLIRYAADIPVGDDYNDALRFMENFLQSDSLRAKLGLLYAQNNEHRTLLNRLVYIAMYYGSGSLNFKALMLIGDLSTLALIAALGWQFRKFAEASFIFALFAIFLLNLQGWQSMFWAMTAISNYGVVLFAFAAFAALFSERASGIYWAIAFAFIATFAMGNGLAVWPVGMLCIWVANRQRRLQLSLWLGATALCLALYFTHYEVAPAVKIPLSGAWTGGAVVHAATWLLTFLGACWVFETKDVVRAASVGAALTLLAIPTFFYLLKRRPALAGFMLFLFASAIIVTYSRLAFEPQIALASRYKVYSLYLSALVIVAAYLWLADRNIDRRLLQTLFLALVVAHTAATYCTSLEPLRDEQRDVSDSMKRWLLKRQEARFEFVWAPTGSESIEKSINSGVWNPRGVFRDTLRFRRIRDSRACADAQSYAELPVSIRRNPRGMVGEMTIKDESLVFYRVKNIVACIGSRTYSATPLEPSRDIDGQLTLHYLKLDPVENANHLLVQTVAGAWYRGAVQQLPAPPPVPAQTTAQP